MHYLMLPNFGIVCCTQQIKMENRLTHVGGEGNRDIKDDSHLISVLNK